MRNCELLLVSFWPVLILAGIAFAQRPRTNYDESKVPKYTLPDPLVTADGKKVTDAETWRAKRRPEILELFRAHVYGRAPGKPDKMTFHVFDEDRKALGGKATRRQVRVRFTGDADGPGMDVLIYLPGGAARPAGAFVGLNFGGNHSIHADPGITLSQSWMRRKTKTGEESRGTAASRWPV